MGEPASPRYGDRVGLTSVLGSERLGSSTGLLMSAPRSSSNVERDIEDGTTVLVRRVREQDAAASETAQRTKAAKSIHLLSSIEDLIISDHDRQARHSSPGTQQRFLLKNQFSVQNPSLRSYIAFSVTSTK